MAADGKTIVQSTIGVWGGGRYSQPVIKGGSPAGLICFNICCRERYAEVAAVKRM